MSAPTIILLGAGGQLGREWQDFFLDNNIPYSGFSSSELDIKDASAVQAVINNLNPDIVINCAAYTKVDKAEIDSDAAFAVNAASLAHLSALAVKLDFLLVHYSTDYVFSGHADDSFEYPNGYPVNAARAPLSVYGKSKAEGEAVLEASGARFLLLRVAWLCGRHGHNFVKTMLRLGKEREELRVVNDQIGAPSFCENVVFNTWALLEAQAEGVFHIASEDACTWFELAEETLRWSGIKTPVLPILSSEFPTPAKRPHYSRLDISKTSAIPGTQLITWKQGLHSLLHQLDV